jgi:hypothetical protein
VLSISCTFTSEIVPFRPAIPPAFDLALLPRTSDDSSVKLPLLAAAPPLPLSATLPSKTEPAVQQQHSSNKYCRISYVQCSAVQYYYSEKRTQAERKLYETNGKQVVNTNLHHSTQYCIILNVGYQRPTKLFCTV